MNKQELSAEKYLSGLSIGNVAYEPYGKSTPPDFSAGSTIGVEVRRLNQNYFEADQTRGLEEVDFPLHQKFTQILRSYDGKKNAATYLVIIDFKRPLPGGLSGTSKDIHKVIDQFLATPKATPCELRANSNVSLHIIQGSHIPDHPFVYGGTSDDDSGGAILQLYSENINHCIRVKDADITRWKGQYDERWLLLVDTMMFWDLDPDDVQKVRSSIPNIGRFNKLMVIDYNGNKCLLNIP